jgi:hypothetical protein
MGAFDEVLRGFARNVHGQRVHFQPPVWIGGQRLADGLNCR